MSCSIHETGARTSRPSPVCLGWPPWASRWLDLPPSPPLCYVWGCVLIAGTLAPSFLDCLDTRSEILDHGRPTATWVFTGHWLKKSLVASLVVNVTASLVSYCRRGRPPVPLLALIPLHLAMLASARSSEISHQYRVERASRSDME